MERLRPRASSLGSETDICKILPLPEGAPSESLLSRNAPGACALRLRGACFGPVSTIARAQSPPCGQTRRGSNKM
eukprot:2497547-Prymnesium_polylepis.1